MKIPEFKTRKQVFEYLIKNKVELETLKKSQLKFADAISESKNFDINKAFEYSNEDNIEKGIIKRAIVGNTYGWLDSHGDVHIEGIFTKTLKENKAKVMHLHDHIQQLDAKVGKFSDVVEQKVKWSDLAVNKAGETTSLIGISEIRKEYNAKIYSQYLNKEIDQHSVGMIYVKMFLCINDNEYKDEYTNWNKYINQVGNIEKATEQGYFWAVTEAKLKEISAVIAGSNELTPTIEPTNSTLPKAQPQYEVTPTFSEYFINNFKL